MSRQNLDQGLEISPAPTLTHDAVFDEKIVGNGEDDDSKETSKDEADLFATPPPLSVSQEPQSTSGGIMSWLGVRSRSSHIDLDEIATQPSVFDQPEIPKVYIPDPMYEGAHRFEPSFRWTWREEQRLVRKIDYRSECQLDQLRLILSHDLGWLDVLLDAD